MNPFGRIQVALLVVALSADLAGQSIANRDRSSTGLVFVRAKHIMGLRGSSIGPLYLGDQSLEVRAEDFSPEFARRNLLPLMRKGVWSGQCNGRAVDLYVGTSAAGSLLFQGDPGEGFKAIADTASLPALTSSVAAVCADYDRSHIESLFLFGAEGIRLYREQGREMFVERANAGLSTPKGVLFTDIVLADLDEDGFLDVIAGAYTDLAHLPAKPSFTFPNDFSGAVSRVYRNNGNGTFTDITRDSSLSMNPGRTRKVIVADFNGDGRVDVLLLRDDKPPALYLNRGGLNFDDSTWVAGDDLTSHAFFEGAAVDFNHDGNMDLALWSTHSFRILMNQGKAKFKRLTSTPMPEPELSLFGFRGGVADFDGNGFDDVITVDAKGIRRVFLNRDGAFHEVSLVMPAAYKNSFLMWIGPGAARKPALLALLPNGSLDLLERP